MFFENFIRKYRFSNVELKHLTLGTALFTAVMVSIFFTPGTLSSSVAMLTILLLVILTAPTFFLHEIGHKINAQRFNLWAEFRIEPTGAFITLISIILPFKFVAPGAVMIRANDYSEVPAMGKVAGYGPAVNIVIGGFYLIVSGICFILTTLSIGDLSLFFYVFYYAAGFSFFLGIFNMLPFGPLDGKKVKFWNNTAFWILFIISGLLALETFISYFMLGFNLFLFGSFIYSIDPVLYLFYPLVLGIITFGIGYYILKKLSDPYWEPGKQTPQEINYQQYYYKQEPDVQKLKGEYHSSSAPMNAPCTECGKRDLLPFRCTSCGKIFCAEHRLPGKHFCVVDSDFSQ